MNDRLVTLQISIDREGNVYEDTQTHGNSWAEVYRGFVAVRAEIDRQMAAQRTCPYHPKYGSSDPVFD